jgi:hypothetical protein
VFENEYFAGTSDSMEVYYIFDFEVTHSCTSGSFTLQTDSSTFDGIDSWTLPDSVASSDLSYGAIMANVEIHDTNYPEFCALSPYISSASVTFLQVMVENASSFEFCSDQNSYCTFEGT